MSNLPIAPSPKTEGVVGPEDPTTSRRRRPVTWARYAARVAVGTVVVAVFATVLGPLVLPYRTYFVRSGSMRPTVPVGALAVYRPVDASQLQPGDIIAFARPGGEGEIVSHRIVAVENGPDGPVFVTKGDANGAPDGWRVPAAGPGWRYAFDIPYIGYVVGGLGSTRGRLVVVAVSATAAATMALLAIWRPRRPKAAAPGDKTVAGHGEQPGAVPTACAEYDFKDALTVLLGHSNLLLRTTAPDDPRRADVDAIGRAARRAIDLGALLAARARTSDPDPSPWATVWPPAITPDGGPGRARSDSRHLAPSAPTGPDHHPAGSCAGRDAHAR